MHGRTSSQLLRICAALAVAVAAVVLGGCVVISSTPTSQPASMGPLRLTVNLCANGSPGCSEAANTGSAYGFLNAADSDEENPTQILIAVRLPDGSTPPATLQTTYNGSPLTFARSASYESQLQALEPAAAGERWWGWLSTAISYGRLKPQGLGVTIETTLPRPADGGPYPSPMRWRPIVGARHVTASLPADRPVACGSANAQLYSGLGEGGAGQPTTVCVDHPSPAATRGFVEAPLIDFGVVGNPIDAPSGSTVTATFIARRSGASDPATTFALSAATDIPGGSVSLDRASVSLSGDSTQPVLATVKVPQNAIGETRTVTLTATAAGKPTRTGTAAVTVLGPPAIRAAKLSATRFRAGSKVKPRGKGKAKAVGTKLSVELSKAATLSIAVERKLSGRKQPGRKCSPKAKAGKRCTTFKRLGTLQRPAVAGANTIAFPGKLRRKALAPGRYRFVLVATDAEKRRSASKLLAFAVLKP